MILFSESSFPFLREIPFSLKYLKPIRVAIFFYPQLSNMSSDIHRHTGTACFVTRTACFVKTGTA